MQPGGSSAHPSSLPEAGAVDVPGRPDFVNVVEPRDDRPIPATAVRAVTPERERRTARPECVRVYARRPSPERPRLGQRVAYAFITPAGAACKADPGLFIRRAIHAAVPPARFEFQVLNAITPWERQTFGDGTLIFSPEDREAAMEKQPFALDGGAASLRLVRYGETSNVRRHRMDALAHVALLKYPKEQRNEEDIRRNCSGFGYLLEIGPECYDEPDLSPVRVVLSMEHHREIPREVRIRYASDFRHRNVVPVQILRLWDRSLYTDADGKYVSMYPAAAAAVVP